MVRGLAIFQQWFKDFENHYVLIGGTAAAITMIEAGLTFRLTKDLDIVLHVEVLTPEFGQRFWEFVHAGGYQQKRVFRVVGRPTFLVCGAFTRWPGTPEAARQPVSYRQLGAFRRACERRYLQSPPLCWLALRMQWVARQHSVR